MRRAAILVAAILAAVGVGAVAQRPNPLAPPVTTEAPKGGEPVTAQPQPQPSTNPQLTPEDVSAWLDGYVPYALANGDIAGAVVVVVRNGQVLTQRGYGYADIESRRPVDPDRTLFRPGSVSKLFTWTAVMQQVEQGRIELDADINQYLDFEIPAREGRPVTMRHLMTHTAGFEESLKNLIGYDAATFPSYSDLLKRWVPHRVFQEGTTPAYSNYATSLAGYIVERVSGEPFNQYVERHIFAPLGMASSSFAQPLPERLQPMMSTGYARATGRTIPFEIVGPAPAGSLSSTGADMGRFMIAHLNRGAGLLRPETAQMMHTSINRAVPHLNGMALGFYQTNLNGRRVIAHGGDTTAFHSSLNLFLDENVGIYISMNSSGRDGITLQIRNALFENFADRYFPAPRDERRVPAEQAAEHARMMTGNWYNSRGAFSSFMNITQLMGQVSVSVDEEGRPVVPVATGVNGQPRRWVEVEPFLWQDLNSHERLSAQVVDGEIVRFGLESAPFMVFDRIPWYKNAALLMPLLLLSLAILFLTVILWPVRALVRRSYGTKKLPLEGMQRRAHFFSRYAALAIVIGLLAWMFLIQTLSSSVANFSPAFDTPVFIVQLIGFVAFLGGLAVLAWNAWVTWRTGRRWPAKVWSILLVLAALVVVWVGFAFKLLSFGANY